MEKLSFSGIGFVELMIAGADQINVLLFGYLIGELSSRFRGIIDCVACTGKVTRSVSVARVFHMFKLPSTLSPVSMRSRSDPSASALSRMCLAKET